MISFPIRTVAPAVRWFVAAAASALAPLIQAQVTTAVECDLMGLVVNVGSEANSLSIYHPGGYLTAPASENVMEWVFTDQTGAVLHEETLVDEHFVSFNHAVPLTDTIFVSVLLTNDSAVLNGNPVACWIEDFVVWETTEVIPGVTVGAWTLGGSAGQDVSATLEVESVAASTIHLFPQPASDWVRLKGLRASDELLIRNGAGQVVHHQKANAPTVDVMLTHLQPGMYWVQILNPTTPRPITRRMLVVR